MEFLRWVKRESLENSKEKKIILLFWMLCKTIYIEKLYNIFKFETQNKIELMDTICNNKNKSEFQCKLYTVGKKKAYFYLFQCKLS